MNDICTIKMQQNFASTIYLKCEDLLEILHSVEFHRNNTKDIKPQYHSSPQRILSKKRKFTLLKSEKAAPCCSEVL